MRQGVAAGKQTIAAELTQFRTLQGRCKIDLPQRVLGHFSAEFITFRYFLLLLQSVFPSPFGRVLAWWSR